MEIAAMNNVEYLIRTISEEGKVVYRSANTIGNESSTKATSGVVDVGEEYGEDMQILDMEVEGDTQVVGKDIILELCRVCGGGSERYMHVFGDEGQQHDLVDTIHKHLPLKISEDDSLPLQLCYDCATTLLAFDDMHRNCLDTQKRLRDIVSKMVVKIPNDQNELGIEGDIESIEEAGESTREQTQDDNRSNGADEMIEAFSPAPPSRGSDAEDDGARPDDYDYIKEEDEDDDIQYIDDEDDEDYVESKRRKSTKRPPAKKPRKSKNQEPQPGRVYQCGACEQMYRTQFEMMKHMRSEHSDLLDQGSMNPIKYECSTCCKQYVKQYQLLRHMQREHSGNKLEGEEGVVKDSRFFVSRSRYFRCDECDQVIIQRENFIRHLRLHQKAKPCECDECGKTFRVSSDLRRHKNDVHRKLKPHACDICGVKFAAKATRDSHRRIHTGEKPFPCPICFKYFRSVNLLGIHKKTHTDIRPWKCKHCEKAFRTRQKLETHEAIHTGIKPYVCEVCLKSFPAMGELNRHKSIHTEIRPYVCLECGQAFRLNRYLKTHILKNHKKKAERLLEAQAKKLEEKNKL